MYSITRRLVTIVLLSQLVLTGTLTFVALLYEREQHFRPFDIALEGRADSVVGAVQDADDAGNNIFLDTAALQLPANDLYEVRDAGGRLLGHSPNWQGLADATQLEKAGIRRFKRQGEHYLAIVRQGTRVIDKTPKNSGFPRSFIVFYASPTAPVWEELRRFAKFLILANSLILLATGFFVVLLLRRGMAPLHDLAIEASRVTTKSWKFHAPENTRQARELSALVTALETALRGLERSFIQQQNFLSDGAHELKTAVTILKSSLQVLALRPRSREEYQAGLDDLTFDCQRLEDLVQKMLALAKIEQVSAASATATGDLAVCLRMIAKRLGPMALLQQVSLQIAAPDSLSVRAAEDECLTLVQNLILNAIQHSPHGGIVHIALAASEQKMIELTVSDAGSGISREHLPFVLERFYRGDRSRSRETGGTGLGLAICRAIAEARGGSIAVQSVEGEGTTVTVKVPAALPVHQAVLVN